MNFGRRKKWHARWFRKLGVKYICLIIGVTIWQNWWIRTVWENLLQRGDRVKSAGLAVMKLPFLFLWHRHFILLFYYINNTGQLLIVCIWCFAPQYKTWKLPIDLEAINNHLISFQVCLWEYLFIFKQFSFFRFLRCLFNYTSDGAVHSCKEFKLYRSIERERQKTSVSLKLAHLWVGCHSDELEESRTIIS